MLKFFKKITDKYYYALESIKNRYPCKIIDVKYLNDFSKETQIKYIAASKINIRDSKVQDILEDPLLIEKFHPTDGVKLGFLACGEILLKESTSIEEAKILYLKILKNMFHDFNNPS